MIKKVSIEQRTGVTNELVEKTVVRAANPPISSLKWWSTVQNNPMGETDYFPDKGVGEYVCFQAPTKADAERLFEEVRETSSCECSCCGDRWGYELDDPPTDVPTIWGDPVEEFIADSRKKVAFLHYWDGMIVEVKPVNRGKKK